MLRTILAVGVFAMLGMFLLRFFFGIFGGLVGLAIMLFFLAVKIAIVGAVIYLIIRIFSPDTARRLRNRWSGRTDV
jgi:predicted lipid-binding transport protein (Tim44 family)